MCSEKLRIFISIFLILFSIFLFIFLAEKDDSLYVPYFHSKFHKVCYSIEIPKKYKDNVSVLINGEQPSVNLENKYINEETLVQIDEERNINSVFLSYPFEVKSFGIKIIGTDEEVKNIIKNVNSLIMFIGDKMYVFDNHDFSHFKIERHNNYSMIFPYHEKSFSNKYEKSFLNNCVIDFLSFFYLWQNYIIPWILLFIGIIIFPRYRIKISSFLILSLIVLVAFLLRYNKLVDYPLYYDENIITAYVGGYHSNGILGLWADWGNPPLVNFIYQLITRFSIDAYAFRIVFVLIGTVGTIAIYLLGKDRMSDRVGLVAAFIYSVSILAISHSQLCRSYIISCVLALFFVFFFFRFLENDKNNTAVPMVFCGVLLINNHLFGIVFLFINFLYGIWFLFRKNTLYKIKSLIFSFFLIVCSFLPFLYLMLKRGLLSLYSPSWVESKSFSDILSFYFGTVTGAVVIGIISLLCIIFRKYLFPNFGVKQNDFLSYLLFFIPTFTFVIYLISLNKSCFVDKYFLIIYGLLILLVATLIEIRYNLFSYFIVFAFIYFQNANASPLFINSYRDISNVLNYEAKNQKYVYFFCIDFSFLYESAYNVMWLPDGIYNDYAKRLDVDLENLMDSFSEISPQSSFFISYYWLHKEDIEKYFGEDTDSNKYLMSVILTPNFPVVKFVRKS